MSKPPLPIEEISGSVLLPADGLPEPTGNAEEELSGSLLVEDPPDGRGPPIVTRPNAAGPGRGPGTNLRPLSFPPPLPTQRASAGPTPPPPRARPVSVPPPWPKGSAAPPLPKPSSPAAVPAVAPQPHPAAPAHAIVAAEKTSSAPKVADTARADRTTPIDPALPAAAAQSVAPSAESSANIVPAAAAAPTAPLSSDVELNELPLTGLRTFLDRLGQILRGMQASLRKVGTDSATKIGPSTKKLGESTQKLLSASATKLGSSTKKLGANASQLARDVRAKLPPASTLRAETVKLAKKVRANLPNSSVLRAETRPRWFLPAAAIAGLVVGIGVVGLLVSALRGKGSDEANSLGGSASAGESSALPAPAASALLPAAARAPVNLAPCTVAGAAHVIAPSAIVGAGVEVVRIGDDVAVGFAPTEKDGMGVWVDAASLTAATTARARSADPVRRVTPRINGKGGLTVEIDTDRTGDRVQGRRTVLTDPPVQLGAADAHLAWAPMRGAPAGQLWPLDGTSDVESLRGAVDAGGVHAIAIAFRRGAAVWMGTAEGATAFAPKGDLAHIDGLGPAVGSPAVAISDGVVMVAWADRATADDPWRLRWSRFKAGAAPGQPSTFVPPAGGKGEQAMSPGLTALSGGRFLLVWTEGSTSGHDVRALTLSPEGRSIGAPLVVSGEGTNAGQGQAAVNAKGQGIIAFLESRGDGFEVAATSIACAN